MKKIKQILALTSAILLFAMYAATFVFALCGSEKTESLFMASIACTLVIPVLLYAYILVYRVLKGAGADNHEEHSEKSSQTSGTTETQDSDSR